MGKLQLDFGGAALAEVAMQRAALPSGLNFSAAWFFKLVPVLYDHMHKDASVRKNISHPANIHTFEMSISMTVVLLNTRFLCSVIQTCMYKHYKGQNSIPTRKAMSGHFERQIPNFVISHDKYLI